MKPKQQIDGIDGSSSHQEQELNAHEDTKVSQQKNPTPHERADLIVRRLENFIREGRTEDGGINFRKWQEMAVLEVANAIRDAEKYLSSDHWYMGNDLSCRRGDGPANGRFHSYNCGWRIGFSFGDMGLSKD